MDYASPVARETCPFCAALGDGPLLAENALAAAMADRFPLSRGHSLIIPKRHAATVFDLTKDEAAALWELVPVVKQLLDEAHAPGGYNVGTNAGQVAGQTVAHAHVHVIPRYQGDVADPRGGVRWVLPAKAAYWKDE